MSRNGELKAGLRLIADDYRLPGGGRKKLSQLVVPVANQIRTYL
jgi:hypothetical protein